MSKTRRFAVTKNVMLYTGYPDDIPVIIEYSCHYSNRWVGKEDIAWMRIKTKIIDTLREEGASMLETGVDVISTFPVLGPGAGTDDISMHTHGFIEVGEYRCGRLVEKDEKKKKVKK